jgi:type I restriction enzyme S subunit
MILRDEGGIQIQSSEASVKSYKIVEPGDFVISLRSFQGGLEYSDIKGICSPAYIILKPKEEINDRFFKHYFKKDSFIERLSKTVVGIRDGKQISYDAFGGVKLNVPSVEEQKVIGDFLDTIGKRIEMSQSEIDQMKDFKKGLLQQMFV